MKKIFIALTMLLSLLLACEKTTVSPKKTETASLRAKDSLALVAIYNACDGANWIEQYSDLNIWSDITKPITDSEHWRCITTEVINGEVRVTQLFLINNSLEGVLPDEIGDLSELTRLDLSFNKLTGKLPSKELAKLTKLNHLNLGNNPQLERQPIDFIKDMTQLEDLLLKNCNFNAIAPELNKLQKLKRISIERNKLETLPTSIDELKNLEKIYASSNDITYLPPQLGKLSATLKKLTLNGNKFTKFPECILQLSELTYLDISENQIKKEEINVGEIRKKLPKLIVFNH